MNPPELTGTGSGPDADLVAPMLRWYQENARDLPWRRPDASPWSVLVSEIMLQQTPVSRVLPVHAAWLERWPEPAALAAAAPGDAVRHWGRLGYPRRALRLHASAQAITERYGGQVPSSITALAGLPGIGAYTAAAVASFAFGQRHAVLDTNVRRVFGRLLRGEQLPARSVSVAERRLAESLLPRPDARAARWSVAVMELGALICTAARPRCPACPVAQRCAWRRAGWPEGPARPAVARYTGSDRECRGRLLAVLRDAADPVPLPRLDAVWPDPAQRARALDGLVADGLAVALEGDRFSLPTHSALA
jgi:A/G-specific adenine glycosylase